jgi:hypothetical protein
MKKILLTTSLILLLAAACNSQTTSQTPLSTDNGQTSNTPISYPTLAAPQSRFDTSAWKTYTNTVYGFTIKYPANWQIIGDNPTWETDFSPVGETYYLEGGPPPVGVIRIVASPDVKFDASKYNVEGLMQIAGKTAYKSTNPSYQEISIYFNVNDTPLIFVNDVKPEGISGAKADQYNEIFDTMLTTLQFK